MSTPRTLQRLERILVMVPWLLEHPGVPVDEVCERFGVTRDEVAQDLDVLGYCGLPGYGGGDLVEASIVGDRVSVRMADFFRRPLRLSVREAVTLLLAARALAAVDALPESAGLARAIGKLQDALGVDADAGLAIDLRAPGDELLPLLRRAVEERRLVRLVYRSASKAETRQRDVEPWGLVAAQGAWYLQGYCRDAAGARDFRLDRVRDVEVLDEQVQTAEAAASPPVYEPDPDDVSVVLELDPPAWWLLDAVVADAVEERDDGVRVVRLRTPALEWVARLVLQAAPDARTLAPDDLRARVRALADATAARYHPPAG